MQKVNLILICCLLVGCAGKDDCMVLLEYVSLKYTSIDAENLPPEWVDINQSCSYQERENYIKLMEFNLNSNLHKTGI